MTGISAFFGLQTARRGLPPHQRALDPPAHNIANASTEGYSRQQAVLTAAHTLDLPGITSNGGLAMLGSGVDVESFNRVRDAFADLQFRAQNMALGQYSTQASMLNTAETSLSEPSDNGIGQVLAQFWSSWDDLANHPEAPATRQALVNQASLLTDRLNTLQKSLGDVRTEAQTQYAMLTGWGTAIQGTRFFRGRDGPTIGGAVTASTVRAATPPAPAGANDVALAMSVLRGGSADTAYANLVARMGGESRAASQQQATSQTLVDAAQDRRQSASGVSMDEEMTNMVRFQRGYQASARVMSTMDEMLDTLINRTGRVGL